MTTPTRDWDAADYAKNSAAQLEWAKELMGKLNLEGGESVLDIGCGDGKVTALLSAATPYGRVVGIDSAPSMIRLATERFPGSAYPGLSFRVMDATDIRFEEKFDVAFSNAALHWVRNHEVALRGVRGCMNPGGRVLFQMGGRGNAASVIAAVDSVSQSPQWRVYFKDFVSPYTFHGPEDYGRLLDLCGFEADRVELIVKDMMQAGADGFLGWFRTTWFPYTNCVPEEQRETFLREVVDRFLERSPVDSGGNVHVEMVRLEVQARVR